jgi:hypothetical protein
MGLRFLVMKPGGGPCYHVVTGTSITEILSIEARSIFGLNQVFRGSPPIKERRPATLLSIVMKHQSDALHLF